MNPSSNILSTIRERYNSFSRTQRQIADYILQNPDTVCFYTLKQLAAEAHTTESTVLTFSHQLGYTGYADMRNDLQGHIVQWMSPNEKIKTAIALDNNSDDICSAVIDSELKALKNTYSHISRTDLDDALQLLFNSKRVFVYASDYASTVSNLFARRFRRLGMDVTDLGGKDIPAMLYYMAQMGEGDLLVFFSYLPYLQLPVDLARHLHNAQGVKILCFSDKLTTTCAQFSDVVLTSVTKNPIFFNSYTAPISLINLLACMYITEQKEQFNSFNEKLLKLQKLVTRNSNQDEHFII